MSNTKIVRLERTEFTLDDEGKKEYEKAMLLFKEYMLVGGMPQSLSVYIDNNKDYNIISNLYKRKRRPI